MILHREKNPDFICTKNCQYFRSSHNRIVGLVTSLWAETLRNCSFILCRSERLFMKVQTGSGAHRAFYTLVTKSSLNGVKVTRPRSWPLTPNNAKIIKYWSYTPTFPYAFTACTEKNLHLLSFYISIERFSTCNRCSPWYFDCSHRKWVLGDVIRSYKIFAVYKILVRWWNQLGRKGGACSTHDRWYVHTEM